MNRSLKFLVPFSTVLFFSACAGAPKPQSAASAPAAVAAPADAKPVPAKVEKAKNLLECAQGEDKRTIAIESKGSGCEVRYTKFGNSEVVANAVHTPSFCAEVKDKIREHLEAGQFTCR